MKRGYWLTALLLALIGLVFFFLVFGYAFTGIVLLGTAALIFLFGLLHALKSRFPRLIRFLHTAAWAATVFVLCAAVVTAGFIIAAGSGAEDVEQKYVIVLGAGVNGSEPSRSLQERIDAAAVYLYAHPDAAAVLSGGRGSDEDVSEADCMFRCLTEKGISPERLLLEDQATSTEENIRFSLDRIEEETGVRPKQCAVLSGSYHLLRASLLARREGLEMVGVSAPVSYAPFYGNMLLREIVGVWYTLIS